MRFPNVPGVAWIALVTFLAGWFSDYFGMTIWGPLVVVALGALAKGIELYLESAGPQAQQAGVRFVSARPGRLVRFFWG